MNTKKVVSKELLDKWKIIKDRKKAEGHLAEFLRNEDPEGILSCNELATKIFDWIEGQQ